MACADLTFRAVNETLVRTSARKVSIDLGLCPRSSINIEYILFQIIQGCCRPFLFGDSFHLRLLSLSRGWNFPPNWVWLDLLLTFWGDFWCSWCSHGIRFRPPAPLEIHKKPRIHLLKILALPFPLAAVCHARAKYGVSIWRQPAIVSAGLSKSGLRGWNSTKYHISQLVSKLLDSGDIVTPYPYCRRESSQNVRKSIHARTLWTKHISEALFTVTFSGQGGSSYINTLILCPSCSYY